MFGNPVERYTIQRFWGRFWHPLFGIPGKFWAGVVVETLGITNRRVRNAVVAGILLGISGVGHALVTWRLGGSCVDRDLWFWGVKG